MSDLIKKQDQHDHSAEIAALEKQLYDTFVQLNRLRAANSPAEVENYEFETWSGSVSLLDLFGEKDTLIVIHNMGQACRYCTIWADGINPFLSHLEEHFSVALVSKDSPHDQRRFANARGWRFRMASHGGGRYIREQSLGEGGNVPGIVCYVREGDRILRKNRAVFGPGDEFCSFWNIISLAGEDDASITPQFSYWKRPEHMDDGGKNLN